MVFNQKWLTRFDFKIGASPVKPFCILGALLIAMSSLHVGGAPARAAAAASPASPNSSTVLPSLFPEKPLFGDALFSDNDGASQSFDMGKALDSDTNQMQSGPATQLAQHSAGSKKGLMNSAMRAQMQRVAQYLVLYGKRNQGRFPGYVNDEMIASQVQLSLLVPNNPYSYGLTQNLQAGEPSGVGASISPMSGSPVWGDNWTSHLQAQQNGRIQLSINQGLTPEMANSWVGNTPQEWTAAPGTISAVGNGQGFFIVWGADADGKPVSNPMNGMTYIISGSTSGTINDTDSPNEDGGP